MGSVVGKYSFLPCSGLQMHYKLLLPWKVLQTQTDLHLQKIDRWELLRGRCNGQRIPYGYKQPSPWSQETCFGE